ncbi:MAG: ParB/RepB/Spo0J family partition protein [Acidimicrobiales bacterium]
MHRVNDIVVLDRIRTGERDRIELGDIVELAASIDSVGLLHPVVVTADFELVAGERRLAAVRSLGWTEVPVTVVDLASAADVLRAEMDENTCRRSLSAYEASRARERRARVLAPKAAEREQAGVKQPSAKLAEGKSKSERETRKVAALGTGYSGSTLDKVDRIRDAAERGVVRRGKTEVPAPEPVREAARAALADVKQTGAAIESSHRKVTDAIERYIDDDADIQRLRRQQAWFTALRTARPFREFDASSLTELLSEEDWKTTEHLIFGIAQQVDVVRASRPNGLRVINGEGRS